MKLLAILLILLSCSKNKEGMEIVNLEKGDTCVNGWTYGRLGKTLVTLFDYQGKPISCSMQEQP